MSLTMGSGPFGHAPSGTFNFERNGPRSVVYLEESPRRVRVEFNGEVVADSRRVRLLHETGHLPVYYFPIEDVAMELLRPSERRTTCPFKGEASYYSVVVGNRTAADAVWRYAAPLDHAPPLADYVAFYWNEMDHWYEEDEEIFVHPVDPYHRVDVRRSSRHVIVSLDGTTVADTRSPLLLFETGLPTRYYITRDDCRMELLSPTASQTRCPYKGTASYVSAAVGNGAFDDIAWSYEDPIPGMEKIAGYLCFYNERVDITVEGELQPRPRTPWSR